jgi:serine/threonine-protein kinase PpkA
MTMSQTPKSKLARALAHSLLLTRGALWTGAFAVALALPTAAQETPLLMPGKTQLFQRVLLQDQTIRRDAPNGREGAALAPLTALFVYEREDGWLRVGLSDRGGEQFWIPTNAALDWNQNIVATFEGSENIDRLMFFRSIDPILDLLDLESPGRTAQVYREQAIAAERGGPPSEEVIALGPRQVIDQRRNLYVMPILDFQEEVFDNGAFVNVLKVAVARARPPSEGSVAVAPPPPPRNPQDFRLGVVFLVDTTISMEPFIRATSAAVETVYQQIADAGLLDAVSFGLVGYRDNMAGAPGLEYATQTYVTLDEGRSPERFLQGIATMREAKASTRHWREDAYSGVLHVMQDMDWSDYDARFIVLVSDASPREADDELSATRLSGQSLNALVRDRLNGAVAVMHLRTPAGVQDHDRAEASYKALSSYPNQPPFYFPIDNGRADVFQNAARELGGMLVKQVAAFRQNPGDLLEDGLRDIPDDTTTEGEMFSGIASAGRAMQLAFLGRLEGAIAPDVFEAYVADRDFDRTGLRPLSVRVLITKAQLSALYDALRIIVEKGEENVIDPDQFFAQVLGAAADMSRSPDQVSRRTETTLAQATLISEYIEDLPYRSRIMTLTEQDWLDMSFSEQAALINELYDKINRYEQYNAATDLWVDYLGAGAVAQNLLYPLPLDALP